MRIAYLGQHAVSFSTESHIAQSFEALGHQVERLQEGEVPPLEVAERAMRADLFAWTQTYDLAHKFSGSERAAMLGMLTNAGVPSIGLHLDRWWGLDRETQIEEEVYFTVDALFTADGGHDQQWKEAGINHHWMPPGIVESECYRSSRRFTCPPIIFVGSWRHYAHEEWWTYRSRVLEHLRDRYGRRFGCFPRNRAVRGRDLNALYNTASIVIGDSCLSGGATHYISDRVPETVGRGGFLIHPEVEGVFPELYEPGVHLETYALGDLSDLDAKIDYYLKHPREREEIRRAGLEHVKRSHTYRVRMQEVLETLVDEGLLKAEQLETEATT